MIIDAHTHWGICWEERDGADPSRWLEVLDRNGFDRAVVLGHRGLVYMDQIERGNDGVKAACDRSGGRMIPLASVHPAHGDRAVAELERCLRDLGMRGLKLHPWLQGSTVDSPVMDELIRVCGRYNVPLLFHDGTPSYSMPSQIGGLALRFPDVKFILGHSGLLWLWRSALSFGLRCDNLYLALAGCHLAAARAIVAQVPAERIMWGSDFGFGWADPIGYLLHLLDHIEMSDATRSAILGENAARLFGSIHD